MLSSYPHRSQNPVLYGPDQMASAPDAFPQSVVETDHFLL